MMFWQLSDWWFPVSSYFGHLEGCGADLHKEIRDTYYQFVLFLVKAIKGFSSINDRYWITIISRENSISIFFLILKDIFSVENIEKYKE